MRDSVEVSVKEEVLQESKSGRFKVKMCMVVYAMRSPEGHLEAGGVNPIGNISIRLMLRCSDATKDTCGSLDLVIDS